MKISALPNASALTGTEEIAAVQSGATVNITPAQILTWLLSGQLTIANKFRLKADGSWQLFNADSGKYHTLTITGADGSCALSIGAGES